MEGSVAKFQRHRDASRGVAHGTIVDDDDVGAQPETAPLIDETKDGRDDSGGAEDPESSENSRSCTTIVAHACSASAHAVWSYTTVPFYLIVSRLWAATHASNNSDDATTHSPRAVTCSSNERGENLGKDRTVSVRTPVGAKSRAAGNSSSVDGHGSPLYTSFHPGDGYETLEPHPSAPLPDSTQQPSMLRRSPQPRGKREQQQSAAPTAAAAGTSSAIRSNNDSPTVDAPAHSIPTALDAIATSVTRGPIYTVYELERRVSSIALWLPLSIKFSIGDQGNNNNLRSESTSFSPPPTATTSANGSTVFPSLPLPSSSSSSTMTSVGLVSAAVSADVVVPLHVMLCGPLRRPLCSPALDCDDGTFDLLPTLSDVEDLILEDTVGLSLHALTLVDLSFLATDYEPLPEGNSDLVAAFRYPHRPASVVATTPDGEASAAATLVKSVASAVPLPPDPPEEPFDVVRARVLGMVQNLMSSVVVERRGKPFLLKLSFVRCRFTPGDLLDALRLPGAFVESLAFVHCPLADAHIAALLRRARQDESFFSHMRSLTLSGTLSVDSVRCVLRFLDEEVESPVLCELNVPALCVAAASGHPISVRLPNLLVNGKRITTIRQT